MFKSFHGWRIVASSGFINMFSVGIPFYAYSIFYIHLQNEFNAGRFLISSTLSIMIIAAGVFAPICGQLVDKFSLKNLLSFGAIIFGVGLILLGFCQTYYQFLIVYGSMVALGMTLFGNLTTSKLISNWFKKKIGSAIGYATLGISLSGVFIPPISVYLISLYGWRATYIIFGVFLIIFFIPFCRYLIVNKPSDINQNIDNEKLAEKIDNSVTDQIMNLSLIHISEPTRLLSIS